jgi:hypothetical protein
VPYSNAETLDAPNVVEFCAAPFVGDEHAWLCASLQREPRSACRPGSACVLDAAVARPPAGPDQHIGDGTVGRDDDVIIVVSTLPSMAMS